MAFTKTSQLNIKYEKLKKILDSVEAGIPIQYAFDLAGLPQYFYWKWLSIYKEFVAEQEKKNDDCLNDFDELEPTPVLNKDNQVVGYTYTPISFIENIKKAYAGFVISKHNEIANPTGDEWKASAWLLERRVKSEYAKEETINQSGNKIESIKVVYVDPEDSKDRLAKLEKEVLDNVTGN